LDPFRADIDRLLAEDVWNAVVIFRDLQPNGYTGQLSILREYIRPKRVLRVRRATVRFETAPGRQDRRSAFAPRRWAGRNDHKLLIQVVSI
jgi:transposase